LVEAAYLGADRVFDAVPGQAVALGRVQHGAAHPGAAQERFRVDSGRHDEDVALHRVPRAGNGGHDPVALPAETGDIRGDDPGTAGGEDIEDLAGHGHRVGRYPVRVIDRPGDGHRRLD